MIKVKRKEDLIDKELIYQVELDGKAILQMRNDSIRNYHVSEGKHVIQITTKDYISKKIEFEYYKGKIIEFECYPIHKDSILSRSFRKIFFGKEGIELKIKGDFYL